ncbi:MAG: hypothetical protein ACREDF_09785, partial [Thermoplasmata archaeon]
PLSMVESVENAGRNVLTGETYRPSNQAAAGFPGAVVTRGPSDSAVPSRFAGSRSNRNRNQTDPITRFNGIQGASVGGDGGQFHPIAYVPGAVGKPVLGGTPMGRFNTIRTPGGRPLSHAGLPITGLQPLPEAPETPGPPANTPPANRPEPPSPEDDNSSDDRAPEPGS